MSHLIDLANAVRFAQHGKKEEFSSFVSELLELAS